MRNIWRVFCLLVAGLFVVGLVSLHTTAQPPSASGEKESVLQPKKPGVKRVGVLLPSVTLNNPGDKVDPADAVRNTFIALLNSGGIEMIPLDARLNALAVKEAADRLCDYVLKLSLMQKDGKTGGFFNKILDKSADSAISQATSRIPGGKTVVGNVGRDAAIGAGQEVTQIEFMIKKKDQFILNYELSTPTAKMAVQKSLKAEAQKDNDAVLMPLIEKAADEIATFLLGQAVRP